MVISSLARVYISTVDIDRFDEPLWAHIYMKPHEPSRTALLIARQRAAHQVLDHGSILCDPLAMKIRGEDENDVLLLH